MTKEMTTQEIIKHDCNKMGVPFENVYVNLYNAIQSDGARVFRFGNTLFTSEIQQPKVSQIHMFTADSASQIVKAMKNFAVAMRVAGFKKLITTTTTNDLLTLLKRAQVDFVSSPVQNGYQVEIRI